MSGTDVLFRPTPWQKLGITRAAYIEELRGRINENLEIDGEFALSYAVADDENYRINIIKFSRQSVYSGMLLPPDKISCTYFDHFFEIIDAAQVYQAVEHALDNMMIYIDATYLLRTRLMYFDPKAAPRQCTNRLCKRIFTGPAVYCSFQCAYSDT